MKVSTGCHEHPILHLVGMGRGTYIPLSRLKEECFVTAGCRKNHSFDLPYGKPLEKIKTRSSCDGKMRHASLASPAGGPRERCPFSGRVGGVSIRILKSREPLAHSKRPSLPYPELGHVTASDTAFPAYVNSLARRFSLSTGVWWSDQCYRHVRKARPSSLRLSEKVIFVDQAPLGGKMYG